ncbi:MAG: hypothetical protein Q9212_002339 [Teloschistes hypoglaucus]
MVCPIAILSAHAPGIPPHPPPRPHIPLTPAATALPKLDGPPQQRRPRRYPHECKHLRPDLRSDIHRVLGVVDDFTEDDEHGCGDDGGGSGGESSEEGEEGEGEGGPAGADGEGDKEHGEEA